MMRIFSLGILALLLVSPAIGNETFSLFVPDLANKQLLSLAVNASGSDVSIQSRKPLALPFAPRGITLHPNGRQLIVTGGDNDETPVATVDILKEGALRLLASSRLKHPAGYNSVDRSGRYFLTVNYPTGQVSIYGINRDGVVGDAVESLRTPKKEAHCILTTPDNRFVYIPCVKLNNALYQYAFDDTSGQLTPLEPFNARPPALFGPRHVAYHPMLPIAYFSNEQQLGVSVYEIGKDGQLRDRQHVTTIPRRSPFEPGKRDLHASDIALTADGKFLFVAVRDFNGDEDSVFSFRVDTAGTLSLIDRSKTGDIPWKIDVSPKGNYLIVRETGDQTLSFFKVNSDGSLQPAKTLDLPSQTNDFSVVNLD